MAWIERRGGTWRVVFRFANAKRSFTVGGVTEAEANAFVASTEELLRLLKRNLVAVPHGCTIEEFLLHRGKPPECRTASEVEGLTLAELLDTYGRSHEGKLEDSTLAAIRVHVKHLVRILGAGRLVPSITRAVLQEYVDARAKEWIDPNVHRQRRRERYAAKKFRKDRKLPPPASEDKPRRHPSAATIRKELVSLRTAWNWARHQLGLAPEWPGRRLSYVKMEERLPFMSWDEAERRVKAGDDPEKVWECVYLRPHEIAGLLAWLKERPVSPWVYPMVCFAAYTGARRSEILRVLPSDLDLAGGVVTIREKKRDKRKHTTRRVPLTPFLSSILEEWVAERGTGRTLFCKGDGAGILPREANNYFRRAVRLSKWDVLRGWHVFRHSFISALANSGADQRVIDEFVGHSTDEQRRRYRHIFPDVKHRAIANAFG